MKSIHMPWEFFLMKYNIQNCDLNLLAIFDALSVFCHPTSVKILDSLTLSA
jgi:hypothetical protein